MRVIILRPRPDQRAFVVVVILIAEIPIQPPVDLYRQPCFGRLKVHRIRVDQSAGRSGRIRKAVALATVLIHPVGGEEGNARREPDVRIDIEEVISQEVEAMTQRMPDAVEKVINDCVAVYPVVVVAGTK